MIRLILLSDFTESFSYNLLKGVLMYANSHEPWVVCRDADGCLVCFRRYLRG